jgi:hypothetical protein
MGAVSSFIKNGDIQSGEFKDNQKRGRGIEKCLNGVVLKENGRIMIEKGKEFFIWKMGTEF